MRDIRRVRNEKIKMRRVLVEWRKPISLEKMQTIRYAMFSGVLLSHRKRSRRTVTCPQLRFRQFFRQCDSNAAAARAKVENAECGRAACCLSPVACCPREQPERGFDH